MLNILKSAIVPHLDTAVHDVVQFLRSLNQQEGFPMPVLERTMKTMRLADDVVTFSTFRKTMAECFNRNTKTRRPLLVTQNGVASKVLIDAADFDNIRETLELMDDLCTAEAELDRGEFTTQEEEIREAHAERERIKRKLGL
jgi:prevent-host-death family protein